MSRTARFFLLLTSLSFGGLKAAVAQSPLPTGLPPFGTFDRDAIDTINLGNLNIHFEFPVFAKKGRGLDFYANLIHDNTMYTPTTSGCSPQCWQVNYFDTTWQMSAPLTDRVTFYQPTQQTPCTDTNTGRQYWNYIYTNWVYVDTKQTPHSFFFSIGAPIACYSTQSGTFTSSDGLYVLSVSLDPNTAAITNETVTDLSGNIRNMLNGILTDPNGNQITSTWTDTTANTALVSTGTTQQPSWKYPNPAGGISEVVATTSSTFTLQTNFHCPNLLDLNQSGTSLTTSISLPDGTSYGIVYESTTGTYPSTIVTGRIHSLTLPSGGLITYTYSGGTSGVNCQDGSPATLTKQTPDGTWTYNHSFTPTTQPNGLWTTVVTDPSGNDTVYTFGSIPLTTIPAGPTYEDQRLMYQGSRTSGTLLKKIVTCYNGNFTNCETALNLQGNTPITISRTDVYTYLTGLQPSLSETFSFRTLPTQINEFDFGVNTGAAPTTVPLKATKTTYASLNGIWNRVG